MTERKHVAFVAHQDQENLGVGYIASMLQSKGFDVDVVNFESSANEIVRLVDQKRVLMIGFSLIFQYHFDRLRELATRLRESDIDCHFTVGGHFPSLRFRSVLDGIPEIDSVVRFEGELTACELAERLAAGKDWTTVRGIAYRRNGEAHSNDLRPLVDDLDSLPFPMRRTSFTCSGQNLAFLLASRGCVRNCSFCSIRKFYLTPPGRLRRARSPENVVDEMKMLHTERQASIFLFQDDDFIMPGRQGRQWILDFIRLLELEKLSNNILWKINCRTDEIVTDLLTRMKRAGLCYVYLGIESGNQNGLEIMNKRLTVDDNVRAVRILNDLEILYDFGFMLFDPSSTFAAVRANISFLRQVCGDGSAPVIFCKMVPYAETDIERRLISEGRLKGSIVTPDYDLLDTRLEDYSRFMHHVFHQWMFTYSGLLAKLRYYHFEIAVLQKFYPGIEGLREYKHFLKGIIASSNATFFRIAEDAASLFESGQSDRSDELEALIRLQSEEHTDIDSKLQKRRQEIGEFPRPRLRLAERLTKIAACLPWQ